MLYLDGITAKEGFEKTQAYPFSVAALSNLERIAFKTPITFFAGDNGSGKSTLLEALAVGMKAYAIGSAGQVTDDIYLQHAGSLAQSFLFVRRKYPKVRMFMRAEDVLGYIRRTNTEMLDDLLYAQTQSKGAGEDVPEDTAETLSRIVRKNPLDQRSHGEGFLDILERRLHGAGLYFLDEPESPLSHVKQLALAALIRHVADNGAQLIIATHSPVLLAIAEATIYHFSDEGISEKLYDELDNIQFLRRFMDRPSKFLDD